VFTGKSHFHCVEVHPALAWGQPEKARVAFGTLRFTPTGVGTTVERLQFYLYNGGSPPTDGDNELQP